MGGGSNEEVTAGASNKASMINITHLVTNPSNGESFVHGKESVEKGVSSLEDEWSWSNCTVSEIEHGEVPAPST